MTWAEVEDAVAQALFFADLRADGILLDNPEYCGVLARVAISKIRELRLTAVLDDC